MAHLFLDIHGSIACAIAYSSCPRKANAIHTKGGFSILISKVITVQTMVFDVKRLLLHRPNSAWPPNEYREIANNIAYQQLHRQTPTSLPSSHVSSHKLLGFANLTAPLLDSHKDGANQDCVTVLITPLCC